MLRLSRLLVTTCLCMIATTAIAQDTKPNLDALRAKASGKGDISVHVKTRTLNDGALPEKVTVTSDTEVSQPPHTVAQGVPMMPTLDESDYPAITDEDSGLVYVTGGVGAAEIAYFKQLKADYTLKLLMADSAGSLVSDATVTIHDAAGKQVAVLDDDLGPYLLVKLAPGTYSITASNSGSDVVKKVKIKAGKQTVTDIRFK